MSLDGALRVVVSELEAVGLDPAAVCAAAGVDGPLDVVSVARILDRAEATAGDPLLGLHMAERARGRGMLSYLARAQRTVGDGLDAFARFAGVAWGVEAAVRIEPGAGATTFVAFELGDAVPRHAVEYVVTRTAQALGRSGAVVCEAAFRHGAGGAPEEYERVLRCRVRFHAAGTGLCMRTADLSRPLRTANAEAAATLAVALEHATARGALPVSRRVAIAVDRALAEGGRWDRERLARGLGMSGKTLARRLAAERRRFHDVADDVRRTLAQRLVAEGSLDLGEVALRVGFADAAAFGKAFRRWFGAPPSMVRTRASGRGDA